MQRAADELVKAHEPILGEVTRQPMAELPALSDAPPSGTNTGAKAQLFKPMKISHEWIAQTDTALSFDLDGFLTDLDSLAKSFADQLAKGMFEHIAEVTEAYGQVTDGTDRDLWETMLEAMEKVEFSFDENGNHDMTFVMSPELYGKVQDNPPTAEQQQRAAGIVKRKREAWDASRRLEDLPE